MILAKQAKLLEKLIVDNSPTILTVVGAVGAVATAVLTGRASFKAAEVLRVEKLASAGLEESASQKQFNNVRLTWKLYIPAVTAGATTVAAIICANRISMSRAAALAAAYSIADKRGEEYKRKVQEKFGLKKDQEVKDAVAQDRVNEHPVGQQVIITGNGKVTCYDIPSDRYFMSDMESIRSAENNINAQVNSGGEASVRDFHEALGLTPIEWCDEIGWDKDQLLNVVYSTVLSSENQPCITIDYQASPIRGSNHR